LMCGLGMRPRELKGLPMPRGMKLWKNPGWAILCAKLGEVRRPALTAEIAVEDIRRGAAEAQAAVDEAAQTPEWRRFLQEAEWGEHDLEVQLYVRLG
ncbi:MAG: hypothetical protein KC420_23520, partial [Myxococcales bacterium]|nr:hypothetical protein [Myxococcales bacterium]